MGFVEGTLAAPRILRKPAYETARKRLASQLAEALARVHAIDPGSPEGVLPEAPDDPAIAWGSPSGSANSTRSASRLGNRAGAALVTRERTGAVPADRYTATSAGQFHRRRGGFGRGDRLGARPPWRPCRGHRLVGIRFGASATTSCLAGVGKLDAFIAAYEAVGGGPVDRERVRYWEAFGNVKWAVIRARQANDHLTGRRRSHELASLGRCICEPGVGHARAGSG